ncbi:hypothetical protein QBC40DRAFT_323687 [Triangularia verruculosa]|uniref:Uncharacterized protein n=1 Tax=Triangularia verruculosa TaxID=2587418 RepID=A0AAN6XLD6_9PEZI|nr:hypothetical protein QBC40DRAFT_323687 [Triangularia verruculosa]
MLQLARYRAQVACQIGPHDRILAAAVAAIAGGQEHGWSGENWGKTGMWWDGRRSGRLADLANAGRRSEISLLPSDEANLLWDGVWNQHGREENAVFVVWFCPGVFNATWQTSHQKNSQREQTSILGGSSNKALILRHPKEGKEPRSAVFAKGPVSAVAGTGIVRNDLGKGSACCILRQVQARNWWNLLVQRSRPFGMLKHQGKTERRDVAVSVQPRLGREAVLTVPGGSKDRETVLGCFDVRMNPFGRLLSLSAERARCPGTPRPRIVGR